MTSRTILPSIAALLTLGLFWSSVAAAAWLCVADQSTGFEFENGQWVSKSFPTTQKYQIVRNEKKYAGLYEDSELVITEPNDDFPIMGCKSGFNLAGRLFCRGPLADFRMSKNKMRYLKVNLAGYWNAKSDEKSDQPSIEIGKCTPL